MQDFGVFVSEPDPTEPEVTAMCVSRARTRRTAQDWTRIALLTADVSGYTVEGARHLHVDLRAGTVTLSEVWGGVVTAQRTTRLPRE